LDLNIVTPVRTWAIGLSLCPGLFSLDATPAGTIEFKHYPSNITSMGVDAL